MVEGGEQWRYDMISPLGYLSIYLSVCMCTYLVFV